MVSIPATRFLFLIRVRAVYLHSKAITAFFGLLWFAAMSSSFLPLVTARIFSSEICIDNSEQLYSIATLIIGSIFDTLVFFAISWRLANSLYEERSWSERFYSFTTGEGLSKSSRHILRGGQLHYLWVMNLLEFRIWAWTWLKCNNNIRHHHNYPRALTKSTRRLPFSVRPAWYWVEQHYGLLRLPKFKA